VNCPNCHAPLQQLGHLEAPVQNPDNYVWKAENLYRCQSCRYGENRFMLLNGIVIRVDPEVLGA